MNECSLPHGLDNQQELSHGSPSTSLSETPPRNPTRVPALPAVSVLLVRESAEQSGLELFIQHRVHSMDFAAGMVVYPGGRVDTRDWEPGDALPINAETLLAHEHAWQHTALAQTPGFTRALLHAAAREVAEETGARFPYEAFTPWANWVTPPSFPKRFDTYFFITTSAPDVPPRHLTTEATHSEWVSVSELVADEAAGTITMLHPTSVLLAEIHQLSSIEAIAERVATVPVISPVHHDSPGGIHDPSGGAHGSSSGVDR